MDSGNAICHQPNPTISVTATMQARTKVQGHRGGHGHGYRPPWHSYNLPPTRTQTAPMVPDGCRPFLRSIPHRRRPAGRYPCRNSMADRIPDLPWYTITSITPTTDPNHRIWRSTVPGLRVCPCIAVDLGLCSTLKIPNQPVPLSCTQVSEKIQTISVYGRIIDP